jgi:transposase, IS5 family
MLRALRKEAMRSPKQTYEREGKSLRRRAAGYAHAKQFKRMKRVLRRQRKILGCVLREVRRKIEQVPAAAAKLLPRIERAERIHAQRPHDKNKPYALHAAEAECIGKGEARRPYEFGVKSSLTQGRLCGADRAVHIAGVAAGPLSLASRCLWRRSRRLSTPG